MFAVLNDFHHKLILFIYHKFGPAFYMLALTKYAHEVMMNLLWKLKLQLTTITWEDDKPYGSEHAEPWQKRK